MLTDEQTRHLIALWRHRRATLEKQMTDDTVTPGRENHHPKDAFRSCIDELTLVITDIEHEVERNKRVYPNSRKK